MNRPGFTTRLLEAGVFETPMMAGMPDGVKESLEIFSIIM